MSIEEDTAMEDAVGDTPDTPIQKKTEIQSVVMHPLVLLSATDHYHRVARGTRKRVVGVLLGSIYAGKVDIANSFAVPFEEDPKNPAVFYLDHNYLENMFLMFRKIAAKEHIVGFYSTGPSLKPNDLRIHDILQKFQDPSVFCIIDVRPDRPDLPVRSYKMVDDGTSRTFAHVSTEMGAIEAEEVGVEHLLRDVHDPSVSTVSNLIHSKASSLLTLYEKLKICQDYLQDCIGNNKKMHPEILANLQTIVSLLPNIHTSEMVKSLMIKTNDMYVSMYLASLIRTVIALHDLVNNKIRFGADGLEDNEEEEDAGEEKKQDETTNKDKKTSESKDKKETK